MTKAIQEAVKSTKTMIRYAGLIGKRRKIWKKAERYFKERGIKYQFVDMKEKGLSKGEFHSVCQAVGGYEKLIDPKCKDKNLLALIQYLSEEDKKEKILENQKIIRTPIVRNGKQATVGYEPDVWKDWK